MIDKLPTGERVVELVGQGLRKHWLGREQRFKRVVMGLLTVPAVQSATTKWWDFLVAMLVKHSDLPPDSSRTLPYLSLIHI